MGRRALFNPSRTTDAWFDRAVRACATGLAFSAALVVSTPAAALCPNCLGQNGRLTSTLELLGAFLLVPFAVAYVVFRVIRRACRDKPAS